MGCTKQESIKPPYTGTFNTEQVRVMWYVCHNSSRASVPFAPPVFHFEVCDCVIDETRSTYTFSEMKNSSDVEKTKIEEHFRVASKKCTEKVINASVNSNTQTM